MPNYNCHFVGRRLNSDESVGGQTEQFSSNRELTLSEIRSQLNDKYSSVEGIDAWCVVYNCCFTGRHNSETTIRDRSIDIRSIKKLTKHELRDTLAKSFSLMPDIDDITVTEVWL